MKHSFLDEDEDMNVSASQPLNTGGSSSDQTSSSSVPFCGCLSVQYYMPYFDVDTEDVTSRITNSTVYCGRQEQFLSSIEEKPDLYGPFWVSFCTLGGSFSYFIALTSHFTTLLLLDFNVSGVQRSRELAH